MTTFIRQLTIKGYENLPVYSSKYVKEDSSMNSKYASSTINCNQNNYEMGTYL